MRDCIFCKIASGGNKTVFFEDEKVYAMLDQDWAVKGHSLVVWKEHALNISDLSEEDYLHFSKVCRDVEEKLLKVLNKDKSIVLKSGGLESHFHFHIYPVNSDISWETVRDIFEKKVRYTPAESEEEKLLTTLKK